MSEKKTPSRRTTKAPAPQRPSVKKEAVKVETPEKEELSIAVKTNLQRVRKATPSSKKVKAEESVIPTSEQYSKDTPHYYGTEETDLISHVGKRMFKFADVAFVLISMDKYSLRMFKKETKHLDTAKMVYLAKRLRRLPCVVETTVTVENIEDFKDHVKFLRQSLGEDGIVHYLRGEIDKMVTEFDPYYDNANVLAKLIYSCEVVHSIINPDVVLS